MYIFIIQVYSKNILQERNIYSPFCNSNECSCRFSRNKSFISGKLLDVGTICVYVVFLMRYVPSYAQVGMVLEEFTVQLCCRRCLITGVLESSKPCLSSCSSSASCLLVDKDVIIQPLDPAPTSAYYYHVSVQIGWAIASLGQEGQGNSLLLNCLWSYI